MYQLQPSLDLSWANTAVACSADNLSDQDFSSILKVVCI